MVGHAAVASIAEKVRTLESSQLDNYVLEEQDVRLATVRTQQRAERLELQHEAGLERRRIVDKRVIGTQVTLVVRLGLVHLCYSASDGTWTGCPRVMYNL